MTPISAKKIENLILSALVAFSGAIASYLRDLTQSIDRINGQMILAIEKMSASEYLLKDHENRLRRMEKRR